MAATRSRTGRNMRGAVMEVGRSRSLSVSHVEATEGVTRMSLAVGRMETRERNQEEEEEPRRD